MPRRVTIILAGPPGDSLRVARDHFHEYIKPILVAGALDWDVIEGRREGDVRAGLAEKIRRIRRRNGEVSAVDPAQNDGEDVIEQTRTNSGIKDWNGVQGDLILGRHTWKEYIRGLHEGWLGPLDPLSEQPADNPTGTAVEFSDPLPQDSPTPATSPASDLSTSPQDPTDTPKDSTSPDASATPSTSSPTPKKTTSLITPYILPPDYATATLPPSIAPSLTPTIVLPLPHLLGFLNTPTRLYRFLTRRHLADTTGASVAALVLATNSRPYTSTNTSPPMENDTPFPTSSSTISEPRRRWEQDDILREEETEWHKSAWTDEKDAEKEPPRERVWREDMIIDERIGERMRVFELEERDREQALREEKEMGARKEKNWLGDVKSWLGIEKKEGLKGWEMGLIGNEED